MFPFGFKGYQRNYGGDELPVRQSNRPLVGYRSWLVQSDLTGGLILHSLHIEYVWETSSEAGCFVPSHKDGPIPDPNCLCGLYAQLPDHPLTEWEHMTRGRVHASGTVAMSGRIIRCDAGYKAARATIQSPVIIETECSGFHGCAENVTRIQLPERRPLFFGLCAEHAGLEAERSDPAPMVDAEVWMGEACRQLEARYPDLEFLSWLGGGDV